MQGSDGRGTHHFRRPRAIHGGRGAGMRGIGAALALLLMGGAFPALAQDDPAVQRGVAAEATAANAVLAKDRALANARRTAYQRFAAATGRDPNASDSTIESLVSSMVVEQERSTLNGYSGRYTVRFRGAGGGGAPRNTDTASAGAGSSGGAVPPLGGPVATPSSLPPGTPPILPLTSYVEAGTSFRSFDEWLALRRRLLAQPSVGSVDILAISTEGARLRIGLRAPPGVAAQEMAGGGVALMQAQPVAGMPLPAGPAWRVGLAGGA